MGCYHHALWSTLHTWHPSLHIWRLMDKFWSALHSLKPLARRKHYVVHHHTMRMEGRLWKIPHRRVGPSMEAANMSTLTLCIALAPPYYFGARSICVVEANMTILLGLLLKLVFNRHICLNC